MKILDTFKTRPILVYVFISLLGVSIIFVPVSNTIETFGKYNELQEQLNALKIDSSKPKGSTLEQGKLLLKDADHTKKVFALVSKSCKANNVIVKQFELPRQTVELNVLIENHRITLEGKFASIVAALNEIATELEPVKISSVIFKTETVNKEKVLVSQVTFQSVKLQNENE